MSRRTAAAKRGFLLMLALVLCVQGALFGALISRKKDLAAADEQIRMFSAEKVNLGLSLKAMKQADLIRRRAMDLGMRAPEEGQIRAIAIPVQYREMPVNTQPDAVVASAR